MGLRRVLRGPSGLFEVRGGDAVNVDEGLGTGVFDVVEGPGGDVGDLSGPSGELLVVTDVDFAFAGEEDEELLEVFGAVPAAGLADLQVDAAGLHAVGLRPAGQEPLKLVLVV